MSQVTNYSSINTTKKKNAFIRDEMFPLKVYRLTKIQDQASPNGIYYGVSVKYKRGNVVGG